MTRGGWFSDKDKCKLEPNSILTLPYPMTSGEGFSDKDKCKIGPN